MGVTESVVLLLIVGVLGGLCWLAVAAGRKHRYTRNDWLTVRGGWWLHALAVLAIGWLYGIYPLVAFTRWQGPTGLPFGRRLLSAVGHTLLVLFPLAWFYVVPWSRKHYVAYRVQRAHLVAALASRAPEALGA